MLTVRFELNSTGFNLPRRLFVTVIFLLPAEQVIPRDNRNQNEQIEFVFYRNIDLGFSNC